MTATRRFKREALEEMTYTNEADVAVVLDDLSSAIEHHLSRLDNMLFAEMKREREELAPSAEQVWDQAVGNG